MGRPRKPAEPDGFINVEVSKTAREGLHKLKDLMDARSQAEVIARLVHLGLGVHESMTRARNSL